MNAIVRRAGFIIGITFLFSGAFGQILINEFSASNSTIIEDIDSNDYPDWIELYNSGIVDQNLKGYYITDNFGNLNKWQIDGDVIISAGGYLLLWADGRDTGLHTSFKLSALGEEIAILTPGLLLLDSVSFLEQKTDLSYGRITDGNLEWGYFQQATPNASNSTESYVDFLSSIPEFSIKGGFYSMALLVNLDTDFGGEIRYTTDGSEPNSGSELYSSAISVNSTTILRARIFKPGMVPGPTATQSYFVNENSVAGKLPVVSIATEPANFWDPQTGIYVQNFKPLWDIPVNVELFENDGSDRAAFNELAGIKVNGLYSWKLPQKMLGIYFKKQYGSGNLDYPILHQRTRESYKSFALRASGSDWSYTLFRDMLGQHATLLNMDLDIMSFRPSVVFVNGEYIGINNIREKVDDDYIEKSYNMEPGSFDLVENQDYAEAGDLEAYNYLLELLAADLSDDANYNAVAEIVDIENFTDYVITEMATGNTSIDHNVMAWKPKNSGKWKWVLMDLDRGFFERTKDTIGFYISKDELLLEELLENPGYTSYFARRLAGQLYTSFHPERMKLLVDSHMRDIEAEIPRHINRWEGTTSSYGDAIPSEEYWREEVCNIKTFVETRPQELLDDLESFGFGSTANLMVSTYPENAGLIKIDQLTVPGTYWSGPYLRGKIQLHAQSKPGYEFSGWVKSLKQSIVPRGSVWKYLDTGADLGTGWTGIDYPDDSWSSGKAQLGYGEGDESTVVSYGGNSNNKYITTYFRKTFNVSAEVPKSSQFAIGLLKDDGAVVYLNGIEVARSNMASGDLDYRSVAAASISGESESKYFIYLLNNDLVRAGENTLAVEIHQRDRTSSDLSFDLELKAYQSEGQPIISDNQTYNFTLSEDLGLTALYSLTSSCIIPEIISDDLTLSSECSPFLAQGDVTISKDATLTIEPGVEIWMPEDANIFIEGSLQGLGTAEGRIKIKLNPDYQSGSWGVMSFRNTSRESVLNHLTIEDASHGSNPVLEKAAISAFHADLILDNLELVNINGNPISTRYSDIKLSNSRLHSEVTGDLINVKYGKAWIENCRFIGNEQPDTDAIDYDEVENGVIRNCLIYDFLGMNSDAIDIGEAATNVLIDSIFVFNITDKGVSVGQQSSATIQHSVFINCNMGIGVKDSGRVMVNQCLFYSNVDAVASFEKNRGFAGGNVRITNSILSNSSHAPIYVDSKSTMQISYSLSDDVFLPDQGSNRIGNPRFANPSYFDFELLPGSPAILSGIKDNAPVDMGTYIPSGNLEPPVNIFKIFINAGGLDLPEFIALYNPSSKRIDLSNYTFTKGITLTIPEGTFLDSKDLLYLTSNANAPGWRSQTRQVIAWESGRLSNSGEALQLEEGHGIVVDYLSYENNGLWPVDGFSPLGVFQLIDPGLDNHFPGSWSVDSVGNSVSTATPVSPNAFILYPNPTRGLITLSVSNINHHKAEIYNLNGQKVGDVPLDENGRTTFDLSAYNSTILIIKVGNQMEKVVVIK